MAPKKNLATLLADFDEPAALEMVRELLAAGQDPMALVDECNRGMRIIGERYEQGTYYISGLIMAGDLLRHASHGTLSRVGTFGASASSAWRAAV